jgi:hypothetical protein
MGRYVKHTLSRRPVLPLARLEEIAHHRYCARLTHVLGSRHGSRKPEHLMTAGHQDLDQFDTDESAGVRNE